MVRPTSFLLICAAVTVIWAYFIDDWQILSVGIAALTLIALMRQWVGGKNRAVSGGRAFGGGRSGGGGAGGRW
ncbi:Uncharacterised protein [uncultured archaeon]|nr:Uncharacterised protein [uncultured archaeon]